MKLNQNGSAMLMVIALIGATTAFSYYMMSQGQGHAKSQRIQMVNQAVNSLARSVKVALASKDICTANLAGLGTGDEPTELLDLSGNKIIEVNRPFQTHAGEIRVSKIMLVEEIISGIKKRYLSVIYDTDPNDTKKIASSRFKGKKFELKGKLNASLKFDFCYHDETTSIIDITEDSCDAYYGTFTDWKCTHNLNSKVDSTKVTCPTDKMYIVYEDYQIKLKCDYY